MLIFYNFAFLAVTDDELTPIQAHGTEIEKENIINNWTDSSQTHTDIESENFLEFVEAFETYSQEPIKNQNDSEIKADTCLTVIKSENKVKLSFEETK